MRLLLIVDDFQNGAGNVAQLLALEWTRQGNQVSLLLTDCNSKPRYNLEHIGLYYQNFKEIGGNNVLRLFKMVSGMRNIIEEQVHADMVISFLDYNNTIAGLALWNKEIPLIASERNNTVELVPSFPWNVLRRIAYYRANLITVQFAVFQTFDKGRFTHKCRVTPNIINPPAAVKTEWNKHKVSFVALGRLTKRKQIDVMIDMFARMADRVEDEVELHIWGQGPEKDNLKRMIEERHLEGKVFLDGYTEQVHEELLKHDIYLMTSKQEGFPNSLSEAQAVGIPAIAMECHKGIRELIEEGKSGFVIPKEDCGQFMEKMELLVKDRELRISMGEQARKIVDKYSKENILSIWDACMNEAVKR